jgi:hypothetical protein
MSKEQENKALIGRWFKEFWGNPWNPMWSTNSLRPTFSCTIRCMLHVSAART